MLTRTATRLLNSNKLNVLTKRNYDGILYQFGPPRHSLSTAQAWFYGIFITVGVFGPAFYMMANIETYNGRAAARAKAAQEK